MNFDQHTRTFTCIILQQQPNVVNECSINITYGANCGHNLGVYRGNGTTDVIVIPPIDFIEDVDVYCYTAIIPVVYGFPYPDYFTVGVVGNLTFQTRGDTNIIDNTRSWTVHTPDSTDPDSDLIIVISKLLTIITVLATVIIIITLVKNKHHSQPRISVKYSQMFILGPLLSNCSSSCVCIIILILSCCAMMYWCVNL